MRSLPIISNKRQNKLNRKANNIKMKNIKSITYYKYEEVPSNISQIFLNDKSISNSTFQTNIKNINSSSIPIDHRYYSTINITKKFPLTRNINISANLTKNDSYFNFINNSSNNDKRIYYKTLEKKKMIKKSLIEEFKTKKDVVNMQMMDTYMRKLKEKMKRTKFKLYKIIINNERGQCRLFERKNNHFNDRLHNYLKSDSFYNKNKKYHRNFHFSKNELNLCHDFKKHYIEPNNPELNTKITSNLVLKQLNEEDKKLIYSDPYFFLKENKYLYKITNTKFKTLLYRLKEEEKLNDNNNKANLNTESNSSERKNYKNEKLKFEKETEKIVKKAIDKSKKLKRNRTMENGMIFYNKKYIDKIINEDLNKRLKKKTINRNERVEKEMINTVTKLNTYKKKDYIFESNNNYFKSYNEKTKEYFFKPYSLKKNNERLLREELFHKQRYKQNTNNNEEQEIIIKYQKMLEDIYKNVKDQKI